VVLEEKIFEDFSYINMHEKMVSPIVVPPDLAGAMVLTNFILRCVRNLPF
jgi:hypothetical protein